MISARTAGYIGSAVVLAAWLASAASAPSGRDDPQAAQPVATIGTELLATDVQRQSARLRQRLAEAPAPQEPRRNPFAFAERELRRSQAAVRHVAVPASVSEPSPPPEPQLSLVGVAEQRSGNGLVRTAILVDSRDELYTLIQGETLMGRYTVAAIGADAIELKDSLTGFTRRLALR